MKELKGYGKTEKKKMSERGQYLVTCEKCGMVGLFNDTDETKFSEPWAKEWAKDTQNKHEDISHHNVTVKIKTMNNENT